MNVNANLDIVKVWKEAFWLKEMYTNSQFPSAHSNIHTLPMVVLLQTSTFFKLAAAATAADFSAAQCYSCRKQYKMLIVFALHIVNYHDGFVRRRLAFDCRVLLGLENVDVRAHF